MTEARAPHTQNAPWAPIARTAGTTDLDICDVCAEFEKVSILSSVGYTLETITNFARHINALNTKLPQAHKYSDDATIFCLCVCIFCCVCV